MFVIGGHMVGAQSIQRARPMTGKGGVVVLHDPDARGGFRPGARFTMRASAAMLQAGWFTPGTRLRLADGDYMVINAYGRWRDVSYRQVLVAANGARWVLTNDGIRRLR